MKYDRINRLKEKQQCEIASLNKKINELSKKVLVLEELKHDIGRFATESLSIAEELNQLVFHGGKKDKIENTAATILHTISMISPRIIYSDMELSNGQVGLGAKFNSVVYKKFDKASRILKKLALRKDIKIKFHEKSSYTLRAINSFDMVPFIILENAIKYSPNSGEINIYFDESNGSQNTLEVVVSSIGPYIDEHNIKLITERGFRSDNYKVKNTVGQGLGLYIAKNICTYHGIKMIFTSVPGFDLDNITYGEFSVKLYFVANS